jgi:Ca-activated chloride channel family protein
LAGVRRAGLGNRDAFDPLEAVALMRLGHAHLLWLLLVVPVTALAYVFFFRTRRRLLARLGQMELIGRMAAGVSVRRKIFRAVLVVIALGLTAIALARPQAGGRSKLTRQRGMDLIVALDFSKSMLAKDVYPSRLDRAKRELERLFDNLGGDRVGLIAFAGETLGYPPTTDYAAVKLFWRDLSPWDMPVGGTAIGRALRAGTEVLTRLRSKEGQAAAAELSSRSQVILLLTDGEDTESEPLEAAAEASKLGIKVFTIGIGSRSGELIPEFDERGEVAGYVKDADGKYVTSRLGEDMLMQIAQKTGGEYFHADARQFGVEQVEAALAGLKRSENEARVVKEYDEVYEFPLLLAFLLLVAEACASDRRWAGRARMAAVEPRARGAA